MQRQKVVMGKAIFLIGSYVGRAFVGTKESELQGTKEFFRAQGELTIAQVDTPKPVLN